ncbi:MAG: propanediol utilization protein [Firmicutes bacterium HGW-Firmicutes-7]|nr:MAG: propanediol utilization protein [Firmicutes bacterium HGW-Firmicutes-7]
MDEVMIKKVVNKVLEKIALEDKNQRIIPIEASARHVHLCQQDVERLFGKGHILTPFRNLSQPGQFLSKERVTILGPKGLFKNVAILGPERKDTQAEISRTDAIALGIDAPVKESGKIEKTSPIYLSVGKNMIMAERGAMVAKRHIHMTPDIALEYGLNDKQIVAVKVFSDRPVIFGDVVVRVHQNFSLHMHIDLDEANACGFFEGMKGQILMEEGI